MRTRGEVHAEENLFETAVVVLSLYGEKCSTEKKIKYKKASIRKRRQGRKSYQKCETAASSDCANYLLKRT